MEWMIDNTVNLTDICETNLWILEDVLADLATAGVVPAEEAYDIASYVFVIHANGPGYWPKGLLTESEWDRLTWDGHHPRYPPP
jgi:hypothetical protein